MKLGIIVALVVVGAVAALAVMVTAPLVLAIEEGK